MENINLNIPIFRAEEINSDRQVIGYLKDKDTIMEIIGICIRPVSIKPTTLAIHFPDMLDSQGNKIFASLSEDGKGGDSILIEAFREELQKGYCIYKNGRFYAVDAETDTFNIIETELEIKVIGIQK